MHHFKQVAEFLRSFVLAIECFWILRQSVFSLVRSVMPCLPSPAMLCYVFQKAITLAIRITQHVSQKNILTSDTTAAIGGSGL